MIPGEDTTGGQAVRAARNLLPLLEREAPIIDDRAAFPEAGLRALRESGLLGLLVPRGYGGMGGSYAMLSQVGRVLAEACMSTALIWAMHCQQVAAVVDHGSEDLRRNLLPRVAAGEVYIASVTSERGKGGHLLTALAPLKCEGDLLILERDAPIVTGGLHADGFLITMRASPSGPPSDVRLVYADRRQLRVETRSDWNPMGMRGTHSIAMSLSGRLPLSQIVGRHGFRDVAIGSFVPAGHVAWASCWLGSAIGAFRKMLGIFRDPRTRKEFDLTSELFAVRLARVRLELATVSAFLHRVVEEYERLRATPGVTQADYEAPWLQLLLNDLKVLASEATFRSIHQLIELSGLRYGYLRNARVPLERAFRDLRSASMNYGNDRLLVANGKLALLDREVVLP